MRSRSVVAVAGLIGVISFLSAVGAAPTAAAEYELVTTATYAVQPAAGRIDVAVAITFTNTTPDPAGRFSVFGELKLAIHDSASDVTATDADGDLLVDMAVEQGVNTATVSLREDLRFEEAVEVELRYALLDSEDPQLRVRPSVVVFPAWGFGTASEVSVDIPDGYEVRVDGDALSEAGGQLVSGPIADPTQWLSLVTATSPAEYETLESTVPLTGGTADLRIRAFADDLAWGERTLDLVERALPLLEEEIGLPYPPVGELVLTEAVATGAYGFGESPGSGSEILVAFDEPEFTTVHQLAHVWLTPALIDARWIHEGMASEVAARAAARLDVELPYDPATEATEHAADAFPLDAWSAAADPSVEAYAHPAAWAVMADLSSSLGPEALSTVLGRVAASTDAYSSAEVEIEPVSDAIAAPVQPLDSRAFLDHLEAMTDEDVATRFAERVFGQDDIALLEVRGAARAAYDGLVSSAGGWGAPDPIRAAMVAWRFDEVSPQIAEASGWLDGRDVMLAEMEAAGLSAPARLRQAYLAYGGGVEAQRELEAERAVVDAYRVTVADVNAQRSFVQRLGLIGGPDPAQLLIVAHGLFAGGDLSGAVEAITQSARIVESAEVGGVVRLISAGLVAVLLAVGAVALFRRRASYTSAP